MVTLVWQMTAAAVISLVLTVQPTVKGERIQLTPQQRINQTFDHPMLLEPTWPIIPLVETRIA